MAIHTGSSSSCHSGATPYNACITNRTPSATAKSSSVDKRARDRQREPREIHLADQVRIPDQRQARLVQRHAEQVPHEQPGEREQEIGRAARPRAGHDAEREVQHAGGDNRLQDDPRDAQHGLPVPELDIAPRELEDQVLELDQLVQIDRDPSGGRAQRADRDGFRCSLDHFEIDRQKPGRKHPCPALLVANGQRFATRCTIVFVIDG